MEYRELTTDEREQVPDLQDGAVGIGAVDELGEVVAAVGLFSIVHMDPVWIRGESRKSPFLLRRLWDATKKACQEHDIHVLTGSMIDGVPGEEHEEVVAKLMLRLCGGRELHGRFFMMPVDK